MDCRWAATECSQIFSELPAAKMLSGFRVFWFQGCCQLRVCDTCLAGNTKATPDSMNYRNFGSTAAWPLTKLGHDAYLQREGCRISPWAAVPGYRIETVAYDWMHNIFLGVGRDLVGSGLRTLVLQGVYEHVVPSRDLDATLECIHQEMRADCAKNGCLGIHGRFS